MLHLLVISLQPNLLIYLLLYHTIRLSLTFLVFIMCLLTIQLCLLLMSLPRNNLHYRFSRFILHPTFSYYRRHIYQRFCVSTSTVSNLLL